MALKLAYVAKTPQMKAELHHGTAKKDWKALEKNLKGKRFQKALSEHPGTDAKLKAYVQNYGGYLSSKDVVGNVLSRTSPKAYVVKKLPSGRLACNCRDWQYVHSVKGTDCAHIKSLSKTKTSSVLFAAMADELSQILSG